MLFIATTNDEAIVEMAVAEEGLQFPEPENEQERDKLSLDEAPEKPSTDDFESCRKRCGRDHDSVLEECRSAFTRACIWSVLL